MALPLPIAGPIFPPRLRGDSVDRRRTKSSFSCTPTGPIWWKSGRKNLGYDPYANAEQDYTYRIHTLYLDTPTRDMFRRAPGHNRHKFRVRRYGSEPVVYLERKSKTGDWVAKRRTAVDALELPRLSDPSSDPSWPGFWFRRRLAFRSLRPSWRVSYDRVAHVGPGANGAVLGVTLDRHIRSGPATGWEIDELPRARPALSEKVIVELKYRAAMPGAFKGLLVELGLLPRQASKYRLGVTAWDMASGVAERRGARICRMSEWVQRTFPNGLDVPLDQMFGRLIVAFFLGCGVAGIYRWTHRRDAAYAPTFMTTLVLMSVLVAVVTQVIGQNSARAFGLLGAGDRSIPDGRPRYPRYGVCRIHGCGRHGGRRRLFAHRVSGLRHRRGRCRNHATPRGRRVQCHLGIEGADRNRPRPRGARCATCLTGTSRRSTK